MNANVTEIIYLGGEKKLTNKWTELEIKRVEERLRQETETFNQNKNHGEQWFNLKCFMGYTSTIIIIIHFCVGVYILLDFKNFPNTVVTFFGCTLFLEILMSMISIWEIILKPNSISKLEPIAKG